MLAEYDGDGHRTSTRQHEKDIRRFDEADETGWTVVRVRSAGSYVNPARTLERLRRAKGLAGG